ncbi:MAG TPA: alpha-L-fucosidase [Chitinophagaceae bacterium]
MKYRLLFALVFASLITMHAQTGKKKNYAAETKAQKDQRMKWWKDARFGLFIHWGLYSVPAGVWKSDTNHAEWIRTTAQIPIGEYDKFVGQFDPEKFNADQWVKMAKKAGMKYIVITSKHHDGFNMFNSKESDFDIMSTPFHRDVMKELAAACRKQGIRFCFYHSIMDWHHPDYLPRREWEKDRPATGANFENYIAYLKAELKELLTNYGNIGVLWFDGEWESTWTHARGKDLYNYVRSLEPSILVNNRVDVGREGMEGLTREGDFVGDFGTPEQEIPATGIPGADWESCMTMNNNWGYNSHDNHWKSGEDLVRKLIDIASKGGNFLLNIGPTAEGVFPDSAIERLDEIGSWMSKNGEAIYGTQASPFKNLDWGRCTQKRIAGGTRLYLHVFDRPSGGKLVVPGLGNSVRRCFTLDGERPLRAVKERNEYVIDIGSVPQAKYATVIVMDIKGRPIVYDAPEISAGSAIFIDTLRVKLASRIPAAVIRYTLNGEDPSTHSAAGSTVTLHRSATVRAAAFLNGNAVTPVSSASFEKIEPAPAQKSFPSARGVNYAIYEGDWSSLPDFSTMQPEKSGKLDSIDISEKQGSDHYAYLFSGVINIPADGVYTFYLSSDDGSQLLIGDQLIVNNDGLHGLGDKSAQVALAKGAHAFVLKFFEKTGGDGLVVQWKGPGIPKEIIPASAFFRSDNR